MLLLDPPLPSPAAAPFPPGVLDTSLTWVAGGVTGSQAFAAWDNGLDVWLGTTRSNPPHEAAGGLGVGATGFLGCGVALATAAEVVCRGSQVQIQLQTAHTRIFAVCLTLPALIGRHPTTQTPCPFMQPLQMPASRARPAGSTPTTSLATRFSLSFVHFLCITPHSPDPYPALLSHSCPTLQTPAGRARHTGSTPTTK
jgi:hypothetical protein